MSWLDFICLWVGYCVCVLALFRAVTDGIIETWKSCCRFKLWLMRVGILNVLVYSKNKDGGAS